MRLRKVRHFFGWQSGCHSYSSVPFRFEERNGTCGVSVPSLPQQPPNNHSRHLAVYQPIVYQNIANSNMKTYI